MLNYDEELAKLDSAVAKAIDNLRRDLCRIKKFRIQSLSPWKSNLPEILPYVGSRMECEISIHIRGLEIQAADQRRRRDIRDCLS